MCPVERGATCTDPPTSPSPNRPGLAARSTCQRGPQRPARPRWHAAALTARRCRCSSSWRGARGSEGRSLTCSARCCLARALAQRRIRQPRRSPGWSWVVQQRQQHPLQQLQQRCPPATLPQRTPQPPRRSPLQLLPRRGGARPCCCASYLPPPSLPTSLAQSPIHPPRPPISPPPLAASPRSFLLLPLEQAASDSSALPLARPPHCLLALLLPPPPLLAYPVCLPAPPPSLRIRSLSRATGPLSPPPPLAARPRVNAGASPLTRRPRVPHVLCCPPVRRSLPRALLLLLLLGAPGLRRLVYQRLQLPPLCQSLEQLSEQEGWAGVLLGGWVN